MLSVCYIFQLWAWFCWNLYYTSFTSCNQFLPNLSILASQEITTMAFTPINMVYLMVNWSLSLPGFLLATSFNSGHGYAGSLTNPYFTNFNNCTNSWQIFSILASQEIISMHFYPIKMVYHFENKSVSLVCFLLATSFSSGRG